MWGNKGAPLVVFPQKQLEGVNKTLGKKTVKRLLIWCCCYVYTMFGYSWATAGETIYNYAGFHLLSLLLRPSTKSCVSESYLQHPTSTPTSSPGLIRSFPQKFWQSARLMTPSFGSSSSTLYFCLISLSASPSNLHTGRPDDRYPLYFPIMNTVRPSIHLWPVR